MSALSLGLMGTVLVGLWLFNSRDVASRAPSGPLAGPIQRTVAWLESQGWGQRVLLPGSSALRSAGRRRPRPVSAAAAPERRRNRGEPVTMPAPAPSPRG